MKPHHFLPKDELQTSVEQEINAKLKERERVAILCFRRHDDREDAPVRHMLIFTIGGNSFHHEQEDAFFDADRVIKDFINGWRKRFERDKWLARYGTEPPEEWEP